MFSQTLTNGNSKNEIRRSDIRRGKARGVNIWKAHGARKKIIPDGLTIARAYRPAGVATPGSSG